MLSLKRTKPADANAAQNPTSKAYMRNVGKGKIEFDSKSNELRFYVEKGAVIKKPTLAKTLTLNTAESIELDKNELAITTNGLTDRLVIDRADIATIIYEQARQAPRQETESTISLSTPTESVDLQEQAVEQQTEPLQQPTEQQEQLETELQKVQTAEEIPVIEQATIEAPEPIVQQETISIELQESEDSQQASLEAPTADQKSEEPVESMPLPTEPTPKVPEIPPVVKPQKTAWQLLETKLEVVDSLFDAIGSLNGHIEWKQISDHLKFAEEKAQAVLTENATDVGIDFKLIASALARRDIEAVSKEAYTLLDAIYSSDALGITPTLPKTSDLGQQTPEMKAVLRSYYILNDLFLAALVGDGLIEEEKAQFIAGLSILPSTSTPLMAQAIKGLSVENKGVPAVGKCRDIFKQQLKSLILYNSGAPSVQGSV